MERATSDILDGATDGLAIRWIRSSICPDHAGPWRADSGRATGAGGACARDAGARAGSRVFPEHRAPRLRAAGARGVSRHASRRRHVRRAGGAVRSGRLGSFDRGVHERAGRAPPVVARRQARARRDRSAEHHARPAQAQARLPLRAVRAGRAGRGAHAFGIWRGAPAGHVRLFRSGGRHAAATAGGRAACAACAASRGTPTRSSSPPAPSRRSTSAHGFS